MTNSHPPFFVVGTGRCGSSMFRRLLNERSDLVVPDETHFIPVLAELFGEDEAPACEQLHVARQFFVWNGREMVQRLLDKQEVELDEFVAELEARMGADGAVSVRAFVDAFFAELCARAGAERWGDKTPDYGFCMTRLQTLWPDARFVHLHRDGCDAAMSMLGVNTFRIMAVAGVHLWHLLGYRRQYESLLESATQAMPVTETYPVWRARMRRIVDESRRLEPGRLLNVRYESLLSSPRETAAAVADFLGLAPDAAWLDHVSATVRSDNANKYAAVAEYQQLKSSFGEESDVLRREADATGLAI